MTKLTVSAVGRFSGTMLAALYVSGILPAIRPATAGEVCPLTLEELAHADPDTGSYGGIWADGNVAYVGQFGDNAVHFFDISDPVNPVRFLEWIVAAPNQFCSAQEVKVADGLLFIALEGDESDGVEIVDVRDPTQPQHLTWIDTPGYSDVHTLFFNEGYLYLADSQTPRIGIVDLTTYDPDNPPPRIEQNKWLINVGTSFVHDMTALNGRMYACAWNSGLHIYDVTNVANAAPVFLGSGPGQSTHGVWPTADGHWVVTGEERSGGPVKLYEVTPNGGGVTVTLRDTVMQPANQSFSSHNPFIIGLRVYVAWYQAGLVILDINEAAGRLDFVAAHDTFPGTVSGFNGAWGVYPFLGDDRILVSDLSNGLFVIRGEGTDLAIGYPQGLVESIDPTSGTILEVQLTELCGAVDPTTGLLHYRVSPGGPEFTTTPLTQISDSLFQGEFPPGPCGSAVDYYLTVQSLDGDSYVDPPSAPAEVHRAWITDELVALFSDTFETNQGWIAGVPGDTASGGIWTRVDPNGTAAAPEDDHTPGVGTFCFVTGQGTVGGALGGADLDGGTTTLVSPVMELGGSDATVSYWRWYSIHTGTGQFNDVFRIDVSADGTNWINVESLGPTGPGTTGGWIYHEFQVSDVLTPPPALRLRFVASDLGVASIVEAAVDDVRVFDLSCKEAPTCDDGLLNQGEARIDCGGPCEPCECVVDAVCADLIFCNGEEGCSAFGACQPGPLPCPLLCDEGTFQCVDCFNAADCDDETLCTLDACQASTCGHAAILYGDVNNDGEENADDVLCALDLFAGAFDSAACGHLQPGAADIAPCPNPQAPNQMGDGVVNLDDALAILNAFAGAIADPNCRCTGAP